LAHLSPNGADPTGREPAGPDVAGPDLAGPDLAGADPAGPDLAGPNLAGGGPAAPDFPGAQPVRGAPTDNGRVPTDYGDAPTDNREAPTDNRDTPTEHRDAPTGNRPARSTPNGVAPTGIEPSRNAVNGNAFHGDGHNGNAVNGDTSPGAGYDRDTPEGVASTRAEANGADPGAPTRPDHAHGGPHAELPAEPVKSTETAGPSMGGPGSIEAGMGEPPRLDDPLNPDTEVRAADVRAADLRSADLRSADLRAADLRAADLRNAELRTAQLRAPDPGDRFRPGSTPPYRYGPDLDDAGRREPSRPTNGEQRAVAPLIRPAAFPERPTFPAVRPSTPGGRTADRTSDRAAAAESARHALDRDTPPGGTPQVTKGPPEDQRQPGPPVAEPDRPGTRYESSTFPRRLPYEAPPARPPIAASPPPSPPYQPAAPADPGTGYPAAATYADRAARDPGAGRTGERAPRALPQRVPGRPDVPTVPEPPSVEPSAETPALARIATHLRRGDVLPPQDRQEGFDVQAILAAVREVDGVRGASLRATPAGAHSLRLDLADGADPAEVSRRVARLLQDTMGLDAAMQTPETPPAAAPARPGTAYVPSQPIPAGRAPVSGAGSMATGPTPVPPAPVPAAPVPPAAVAPAPVPPAPVPPAAVAPAPVPPAPVPPAAVAPAPVPPAAAQPAAAPPTAAQPAPGVTSGPEQSTTSSGAVPGEQARRLPHAGRGRASVDPSRGWVAGEPTGSPIPAGGIVERMSAGVEPSPPRPLKPSDQPGPRVVIENVQVNTFGTDATVEVRLTVGDRAAAGAASGPAVDGYLLRLCAMATAGAVDELLAVSDHVDGPARCYVEHAAAVPFGSCEVAVVVLLLACGGWVEQLAGSSVVTGDDRHAMVRATLAAVNRRLEALLS
jgi:uncharacterized protein YjbI with pentapeptide repeats